MNCPVVLLVASFDTAVAHWFGGASDEPAEILSIVERPGEQRTAPRSGRVGPDC